jgi:hypothetical protein
LAAKRANIKAASDFVFNHVKTGVYPGQRYENRLDLNFYMAVWNQIAPLSAYKGCGASASGELLKLKVEILRLNGGAPELLHSFRHASSSIAAVRESMKRVTQSPAWPPEANAFRIVSEEGVELYRWPEPRPDVTKTPPFN